MTPNTFEMDAHEGEGCPVAALGRTIGALERRREELDRLDVEESQRAKAAKAVPLTAYTENSRDHTADRRDDLRAALSAHRARSLAGCLCQIAQAGVLADDLFDLIEKPELEARRIVRLIERLHYSIAMHLEGLAGMTVEDAGMDGFMAPNLNPWTACEERMAWVRGKNAEDQA